MLRTEDICVHLIVDNLHCVVDILGCPLSLCVSYLKSSLHPWRHLLLWQGPILILSFLAYALYKGIWPLRLQRPKPWNSIWPSWRAGPDLCISCHPVCPALADLERVGPQQQLQDVLLFLKERGGKKATWQWGACGFNFTYAECPEEFTLQVGKWLPSRTACSSWSCPCTLQFVSWPLLLLLSVWHGVVVSLIVPAVYLPCQPSPPFSSALSVSLLIGQTLMNWALSQPRVHGRLFIF